MTLIHTFCSMVFFVSFSPSNSLSNVSNCLQKWNDILTMWECKTFVNFVHFKQLAIKYRSSCGRADSVMDSHAICPEFLTQRIQYTFYQASDWLPPQQRLLHVEGWWEISWTGLPKDINMGSCVLKCDVPHQWIAQWQVGPVSVYCDGVGCHVLCLRHGIPLWQHIGQSTTAISMNRCDMTSDVKVTLNPNKQQTRLLHIELMNTKWHLL